MKVEIFGIDVNYEEVGEGIPMLIIPGLFISSKSMMPVIEPIVEDMDKYRRVYIDMPGMGETPKHNLENSSESMIEIVLEFVKKIIGKEPFYMASYSYGGYVATGIARILGEQVIGEVRVCAVIKAEMKRRKLPPHLILEQDSIFMEKLSEEEKEKALQDLVIINEEIFSRYKVEVFDELKKADRKFILDLFFNKYSYDDIEIYGEEIERPTLFIIGKHDSTRGYEDTLDVIRYYKNSTLHLLNRAGHNLQIEYFDKVSEYIKDWLSEN